MSEWISVKDRLPEKYLPMSKRNYLVIVQEIRGGFLHNDTHFEIAEFRDTMIDANYFSIKTNGIVTHWMPLPEPPKEGTK